MEDIERRFVQVTCEMQPHDNHVTRGNKSQDSSKEHIVLMHAVGDSVKKEPIRLHPSVVLSMTG